MVPPICKWLYITGGRCENIAEWKVYKAIWVLGQQVDYQDGGAFCDFHKRGLTIYHSDRVERL